MEYSPWDKYNDVGFIFIIVLLLFLCVCAEI